MEGLRAKDDARAMQLAKVAQRHNAAHLKHPPIRRLTKGRQNTGDPCSALLGVSNVQARQSAGETESLIQ